jgi:hypothetical protein
MQINEKVFKQRPEILKAFGLFGAAEIYQELLNKIEEIEAERLKETKEDIKSKRK